ncbi:MAG: CopG family transcriptional regulator [Halanaerobiales bacterium]
MKRKQIYLDETMIEQIKELADKKEVSQSEIIRNSLRKYINEEQKCGEIKAPLLEMVGVGKSDITDGAINHDRYLYGGNEE